MYNGGLQTGFQDGSKELKQLREPHYRMARAYALGGLNQRELARMTGYSQSRITQIVNSPVFQAEIERLRRKAELDEIVDLRELAKQAKKNIEDDLALAVEQSLGARKIRQQASFKIFDLIAPKEEKRKEVRVAVGLTDEMLDVIQERGLKARQLIEQIREEEETAGAEETEETGEIIEV